MGNTVSGHKHKKHHSRRRKQRGGEITPGSAPVPESGSGSFFDKITQSASHAVTNSNEALKKVTENVTEKVGSLKAAAANVGGRKSRKRSGHKRSGHKRSKSGHKRSKSGHKRSKSGHKRSSHKRVRFSTE